MSTLLQPTTIPKATRFLWLDLIRKCQLHCAHCYNNSGPDGTHGIMTRADWLRVIDQAAASGIETIQLIGGEPTLHPDAADLVSHALNLGLAVQVYSNLVHVPDAWWPLFKHPNCSVATSYYSDDPAEHNAITRRNSHARTLANITRLAALGTSVRVGMVDTGDLTRLAEARKQLQALGITDINIDRLRPLGRAASTKPPSMEDLCGRCGDGKAAVGPDGTVTPCAVSTWLKVGNVKHSPLADILTGVQLRSVGELIRQTVHVITDCDPDGDCSPGYPSTPCSPRG